MYYNKYRDILKKGGEKVSYFSIHNHTDASNLRLLDAINRVEDLMDYAYEIGLSGLCLTEHESLSSHIRALQYYEKKCKQDERWKNFKLGLGNEIYLCRNDLEKDTYEKGEKFPHFILLAKDKEGHRQLRKLSSIAWGRSFMMFMTRVPTHYEDLEKIVKENPGHLIASTACLGSNLNILRKENRIEDAERFIKWCQNIFHDDFYLELQPGRYPEQIEYNKWLLEEGKKFNIKCIVSTDSHYLRKEDRKIHEIFLNSKEGDRETSEFYQYTYMMTPEEIIELMEDYLSLEQINVLFDNTNEINRKIEAYSLQKAQVVPHLKDDRNTVDWEQWLKYVRIRPDRIYLNKYLTSKQEDDRYMLYLAFHRLQELNLDEEEREKYIERLESEATELWLVSEQIKQPLSAYLLTVRTIVRTIWYETDSLVGPSRGSAGSLLFGYLIGMIDMNPMTCGLFLDHRRFVHREKPELSDVDIDSEGCRRPYILQKFNDILESQGGHSLNVATFGTLGTKSAILLAARGMGIEVDKAQYLASMIKQERGFLWPLKDCLYGNKEKDRQPIQLLIDEGKKYPGLLETAMKIEGLIVQVGIHASGIVFYNGDIDEYSCMMKAPNGLPITQWDLHQAEWTGSLKFDLLSVEALDKIHACMNLLTKDGYMEWQGTLRDTYLKYLHPDVLHYNEPEMWKLLANNQILDAFQMDTTVAKQSNRMIHPTTIPELAAVNSLMRLMPERGNKTPVEEYVDYKLHPEKLKKEIENLNGNEHQKQVLYDFLETYNGVPSSQESVMYLSMIPELTNFSFGEANRLRKLISKKLMDQINDFRKKFFEKGKENNVSDEILSFIWDKQIKRQLGYSFSDIHTIAYSLICLQEMNLSYYYPPIYWATAVLTVNAGALENEESTTGTNYKKVASAIGRIQTEGYEVKLPDVNEAGFAFTPNAKENSIIYGLKGISEINDDFIKIIIQNRPYTSVEDFIEKCQPQKKQIINLIKAGAFNEFGDRRKIMKTYLASICPKKARITLQNMSLLIEYNLIPKDLQNYVYLFNFNRYIKQYETPDGFKLDQRARSFIERNYGDLDYETGFLDKKVWKKTYDKAMGGIKEWFKDNEEELINKIQEKDIEKIWNQYCQGSNSAWEMEVLGFYHSPHELLGLKADVVNPKNLVDGNYRHTVNIAGTVLGKDAYKHMVTILTTYGVVDLKFSNEQFAEYNRTISEVRNGVKKVLEKSWFIKGTLVFVKGFKSGETFRVRQISKIIDIDNKGVPKMTRYRYGKY